MHRCEKVNMQLYVSNRRNKKTLQALSDSIFTPLLKKKLKLKSGRKINLKILICFLIPPIANMHLRVDIYTRT